MPGTDIVGNNRSLRIMSHNFNLHPHVILPQPGNPDTRPQRLVIWHILLKIPDHRLHRLVVDGYVVGVHAKNLVPSFSAGRLQRQFDVPERLVNLGVDFLVEFPRFGVPAACIRAC